MAAVDIRGRVGHGGKAIAICRGTVNVHWASGRGFESGSERDPPRVLGVVTQNPTQLLSTGKSQCNRKSKSQKPQRMPLKCGGVVAGYGF